MKINIAFFSLVSVILSLSSCKKDNSGNPSFQDSIPKIQKMTEYYNSQKVSEINFTYDSNSRLVRVFYNEVYNNSLYYDTFIYKGSKIILNSFDNKDKLIESQIFTLNSNNLAIIMSDTFGDERKSSLKHFAFFNTQEHGSNIYNYDNKGFQTLEVSSNEFGGTHRYEKTYSDGNLITSSYQYMAQDTVILSGYSLFKYYTDKHNTIGNLNRGIPFMGKQNANLLLSVSDQRWHFSDTLRQTTTYRYEFDDNNRVIKQYISPQNGDNDDVSYLSFTYR